MGCWKPSADPGGKQRGADGRMEERCSEERVWIIAGRPLYRHGTTPSDLLRLLLRALCSSQVSCFLLLQRIQRKQNKRQQPLPVGSLIPIFPCTCLPPSVPLRASARLHCFAYVDLRAYALIGRTPPITGTNGGVVSGSHDECVCDGGGGRKRVVAGRDERRRGEGGGGVS